MYDGGNPHVEGKADVLLGEFEHTSSGRGVLAEVIRSTLSQRMTHQLLEVLLSF